MNLNHIYDIETYLNNINSDFHTGESTEHSFRGYLQNLLCSLLNEVAKRDADKVLVINEPKRKDYGAPDFEFRKNDVAIAFLETKTIDDPDLRGTNIKQHKSQFDKYKKAINTIAFTDYLRFVLFEDGEETLYAEIAKIDNGKIIITDDEKQLSNFIKIIEKLGNAKPQPIRSAKVLAETMSAKAKVIVQVLMKAMNNNTTSEDKELHNKLSALQKFLVHDMTEEQFADFYAQTIVYGLFVARIYDKTPNDFSLQEAAELIPSINPFLKKIFKHLALADLHSGVKWIVDDLVNIFRVTDTERVMHNYGKDPLVHFYEDFLEAYNPKIREDFGVWYTPLEVVQFIVNAVDSILRNDLGIKDGLADNSEVTLGDKQIQRVQILDPATGTGTFLAVTAEKIHENYKGQEGLWGEDVIKHIIPRLNGFEYLMAPYTMAHLKVSTSLRLEEQKEQMPERLNIFLTNSLEEYYPEKKLDFAKFITDESNAASSIKRDMPVMVVMGNPPYNEKSANTGEWIMDLMDAYKQEPGLERTTVKWNNKNKKAIYKNTLKETNPKGLNNDYCKFIRLGQNFVERTQEGVLAYICGNTFLDTRLFRGMRYELLRSFDDIYIINLHGSTKRKESTEDQKDECIFNILVGVSINIFVKHKDGNNKELAKVHYKDIYGTRREKLEYLSTHTLEAVDFKDLNLSAPLYTFRIRDQYIKERYNEGFAIKELMKQTVQGFTTDKDMIAIQYQKEDIEQIKNDMLSDDSDESLRVQYQFRDTRDWKLAQARMVMKNNPNHWQQYITPIQYRPFDTRWTLFNKVLVTYPRPLLQNSVFNHHNIVLCLGMQGNVVGDDTWSLAFISTLPADKNMIPRGGVYLFPLFVYDELGFVHINYSPNIISKIEEKTCLHLQDAEDTERKEEGFLAIDLLDYIYAILHSTTYRETYHECLQDDFPTIPYPSSAEYFLQMAELGKEIRQLHLLENIRKEDLITSYSIVAPKDNNVVTKKEWNDVNETEGRIYINDYQYFDHVPTAVWNMVVSGYQPLDKWLKDRKGKRLTNEEIIHYQKIIVALQRQIDVVEKIDDLIIL